ncbi:DUF1353 domain-containing protein [Tenacibaculum sp. SSH1-16]|uniref:DUF1353 domain-containing protein n=1 Tax=Tenacibaculum sp. SSH1-16 TaxID=3136667 RepID=UPI0032C3FC59
MKINYLQQPKYIPLAYITSSSRDFITTTAINVELSDGREIIIPKGYKTDLSSKPKWLWSFLPPFDERLISSLIHDFLWTNKLEEIKHHGNIYKAFVFSNNEFNKWNKSLAPNSKLKNWLEYQFLKNFSTPFYIGKKNI